jgi:hypothetical protein
MIVPPNGQMDLRQGGWAIRAKALADQAVVIAPGRLLVRR